MVHLTLSLKTVLRELLKIQAKGKIKSVDLFHAFFCLIFLAALISKFNITCSFGCFADSDAGYFNEVSVQRHINFCIEQMSDQCCFALIGIELFG